MENNGIHFQQILSWRNIMAFIQNFNICKEIFEFKEKNTIQIVLHCWGMQHIFQNLARPANFSILVDVADLCD